MLCLNHRGEVWDNIFAASWNSNGSETRYSSSSYRHDQVQLIKNAMWAPGKHDRSSRVRRLLFVDTGTPLSCHDRFWYDRSHKLVTHAGATTTGRFRAQVCRLIITSSKIAFAMGCHVTYLAWSNIFKGDPRKTQRFQTLITFSLLVVESSFLHREIALSKRFLLVGVPRESVAKVLRRTPPFRGLRPNAKMQNQFETGRNQRFGFAWSFVTAREPCSEREGKLNILRDRNRCTVVQNAL